MYSTKLCTAVGKCHHERHSSSWQRRLPCACATLAQLAIGMCEALPLFIAALTASTVAHCVLRTVNGQSSSPLA